MPAYQTFRVISCGHPCPISHKGPEARPPLAEGPRKRALTFKRPKCTIRYTMSKSLSVTDTLRKAIADSGKNFLTLERESGVVRQSLMKFARGDRHLRGDMIDKLAEYFGLELAPSKPAKRKDK